LPGKAKQQRRQGTIQEALAEALRLIKDPRLGFVTLTGVEVAPDLSYARVFFSAYGSEEEQNNSLTALRHASGFLRKELAHRLQLRHTPQLDFRLDQTPEKAERIMKLLHELEEEDAARHSPDSEQAAQTPAAGRTDGAASTERTDPPES